MIDSVVSGADPPSGNETAVIVMPEDIAFPTLSRYVPIFSKTFSPFAPFPDDVVYLTVTTSPFVSAFPITPSPNSISGI